MYSEPLLEIGARMGKKEIIRMRENEILNISIIVWTN